MAHLRKCGTDSNTEEGKYAQFCMKVSSVVVTKKMPMILCFPYRMGKVNKPHVSGDRNWQLALHLATSSELWALLYSRSHLGSTHLGRTHAFHADNYQYYCVGCFWMMTCPSAYLSVFWCCLHLTVCAENGAEQKSQVSALVTRDHVCHKQVSLISQ